MILLFITSLFVILATILIYLRWKQTFWSRRCIKGPSPVPIFGNMMQYMVQKMHFGEVYDRIYQDYPGASYVGFYKLGKPAVLVRSLDLIKSIMLENFSSFATNDVHIEENLDPLLYTNSFFLSGSEWKYRRNQLTPIFTAAKVNSVIPLVSGVGEKLLKYIEKKSNQSKTINDDFEFEARDLSSKFTIEAVASCSFGLEGEAFADKPSSFVQNTKRIFEISTLQAVRLSATFFVPALAKFMSLAFLPNGVDPWLRSIVGQVVTQRVERNEERLDFLQMVMTMCRKHYDGKLDETTLCGHALTFLTDGYESSSGLICYCLYELAKNPHIQQKIQEDIDEILNNNNGEFNEECIKQLTYIENSLYETLRLHSPDLSLNKICTEDFQLPPQYPGDTKCVTIKAGTPVILPIYSLHRDPNNYKDPDSFEPDRFTVEERAQRHKYSFLGFGEGPRKCPGARFAMMQSKVAIAMIMSKFNVELSEKTIEPLSISPTAWMRTCEDGIWIRFSKRN